MQQERGSDPHIILLVFPDVASSCLAHAKTSVHCYCITHYPQYIHVLLPQGYMTKSIIPSLLPSLFFSFCLSLYISFCLISVSFSFFLCLFSSLSSAHFILLPFSLCLFPSPLLSLSLSVLRKAKCSKIIW